MLKLGDALREIRSVFFSRSCFNLFVIGCVEVFDFFSLIDLYEAEFNAILPVFYWMKSIPIFDVINCDGKLSSGIKIPFPDDIEQHKTGPSNVIEFGTRPDCTVTPLIFESVGQVNKFSTVQCWSVIFSPFSRSDNQLRDTQTNELQS